DRRSCDLRVDVLKLEKELLEGKRDATVIEFLDDPFAPAGSLCLVDPSLLAFALDDPAEMLARHLVAELVSIECQHALMVARDEDGLFGERRFAPAAPRRQRVGDNTRPPRPAVAAAADHHTVGTRSC